MSRLRRAWPVLRRVLLAAFLLTVAVLLFRQAREVDWPEVARAVRGYSPWLLAACAGIAAASYGLYCSFDLLARRYTGHELPTLRVVAIAFVSYAFNLNMGAAIGGAGFRFRLYTRYGLRAGTISRVLGFSVLTNWSGYVLLLGAVLAARQVPIPVQWELGTRAMQGIGVVLLLLAPAWLAACAWSPRRSLTLRGHEIVLPRARIALAQLALSSANWLLMAGIVFLLLGRQIEFVTVLGVLLMGAIAGAMAHIPAGLGVLEAVFVLTLSDQAPRPTLLAALITYRAVYYILPLLLALVVYLVLEAGSHDRSGGAAQRDRQPVEGEAS